MECTQRIECTQDTYNTSTEKICPEQIGFLGICGSKQPVKKGPNKIGRDPQTCSIILNDNSISRQHAVINILNKKDFMLMDLDSSNKTKLLDKVLQPYIPHPLKNGDTVQFGQVFGIFRLLEEDDDLPMTQAVEIPETPVNIRQVSKLKSALITTVPESPDVSDRDDSIIAQSPKKKPNFKSPNNNFIKSSVKIMGIEPIGTHKIDNEYWNSSKKSDSFSSKFEGNTSDILKKSPVSPKKLTTQNSIYDMETQVPTLPNIDQTELIYDANTQVPSKRVSSNNYRCETRVPDIEKLPEVYKVRDQSNVQLNLYSITEKFDIHDAETQVTLPDKAKTVAPTLSNTIVTDNLNRSPVSNANKKLNSSDEEICFDDIDCEELDDQCGSQPLLPPDPRDSENLVQPAVDPELTKKNYIEKKESNNSAVLNDSEEISPSQMVPEKPVNDEDLTDCEDNMIELSINIKNKVPNDDDATDCEDDVSNVKQKNDDDITDCEDDVIEISQNRSKVDKILSGIDDLPTQVIPEENSDKDKNHQSLEDDVHFEDMLTQVIDECPIDNNTIAQGVTNTDKSIPFEDLQTQVIEIDVPQEQSVFTPKVIKNSNSFKRPVSSPRLKKKDTSLFNSSKPAIVATKDANLKINVEDDQNYYNCTQELLSDLCTQKNQPDLNIKKCDSFTDKDMFVRERSSGDSDATERINSFVSNLSKEQVREVIGANVHIVPLSKKKSSDSSDLEVTPKKFNPSKFMMIDLPDSQDIKACDFVSSKIDHSESSDGFEDTEEQDSIKDSPQIRSRQRRAKKDVKLDLMKKFDINSLPTRAITRVRKPTSKILDSDSTTRKMSEKILQSKLGLDREHEADGEVIELNLKRLRSKMEKASNKANTSKRKSDKDENNQRFCREIDNTNDKASSGNKKTNKDRKDDLPKLIKGDQNIKSDKKDSKERVQKKEKELKQQNIKSMFKEPNPKCITALETSTNKKVESLDPSHKSRRSSRNKGKTKKETTEPEVQEVNLESRDKKRSSNRTHSRNRADVTIDLTNDNETVVRRSRRHQTANNKIEDNGKSHRHIEKELKKSKNSHSASSESLKSNTTSSNEQSAVYNLSSETVDTPTNLKRPATCDIFPSRTKKAKSSNTEHAMVRPPSLRGIKTQYVLFTAFPCEEVKLKLKKLGAVIVSDVKRCTVVLTVQIRRTFKFLCALGLGKPIVGPNWVQACADSNMIVDPWLYLLKDEATEKRYGFNLRQSLTCKRNFLKGYNIFCTPNVTPNAQEMKSIVECSGGTWKEGGKSWFCVSCPADKALWPGLRKRGATLVTTEFILGGVLQQRINLDRDKLG